MATRQLGFVASGAGPARLGRLAQPGELCGRLAVPVARRRSSRIVAVDSATECSPATDAVKLGKMLAADWSNRQQAMDNPPLWAHIHVCYRPLPWNFLGGVSFYVESAYDYNLSTPYKTSIVKVVQTKLEDGTDAMELENYKIAEEADDFWFASHAPEMLKDLTPDRIRKLPDCCNTIYEWVPYENHYKAYTRPGKECKIERKGVMSYLDSNITLDDEKYCSWDVGRDPETDEYLWGGASGSFDFFPNSRFADDVPDGPE